MSDNALARVIAQLRKALGDGAKVARYIETVPTIGYRFVAEVVELPAGVPHPAALETPAAAPSLTPRNSPWPVAGALALAVLAIVAATFFFLRARSNQPLWSGTVQPRYRNRPTGMRVVINASIDAIPFAF